MTAIIDEIIDLIDTEWKSGTKKPHSIEKVYDIKFRQGTKDTLVVNIVSENHNPFGIGANEFQVDYALSIDVMSGKSEERCREIKDEIVRIFRKRLKVDKDYVVVTHIAVLHEELRKMYRYIIDIEWKRWYYANGSEI